MNEPHDQRRPAESWAQKNGRMRRSKARLVGPAIGLLAGFSIIGLASMVLGRIFNDAPWKSVELGPLASTAALLAGAVTFLDGFMRSSVRELTDAAVGEAKAVMDRLAAGTTATVAIPSDELTKNQVEELEDRFGLAASRRRTWWLVVAPASLIALIWLVATFRAAQVGDIGNSGWEFAQPAWLALTAATGWIVLVVMLSIDAVRTADKVVDRSLDRVVDDALANARALRELAAQGEWTNHVAGLQRLRGAAMAMSVISSFRLASAETSSASWLEGFDEPTISMNRRDEAAASAADLQDLAEVSAVIAEGAGDRSPLSDVAAILNTKTTTPEMASTLRLAAAVRELLRLHTRDAIRLGPPEWPSPVEGLGSARQARDLIGARWWIATSLANARPIARDGFTKDELWRWAFPSLQALRQLLDRLAPADWPDGLTQLERNLVDAARRLSREHTEDLLSAFRDSRVFDYPEDEDEGDIIGFLTAMSRDREEDAVTRAAFEREISERLRESEERAEWLESFDVLDGDDGGAAPAVGDASAPEDGGSSTNPF